MPFSACWYWASTWPPLASMPENRRFCCCFNDSTMEVFSAEEMRFSNDWAPAYPTQVPESWMTTVMSSSAWYRRTCGPPRGVRLVGVR